MDDVFQNLEDEKNPVSTGKRIKLDEADWKPAGKDKVNRQSWENSNIKVVNQVKSTWPQGLGRTYNEDKAKADDE